MRFIEGRTLKEAIQRFHDADDRGHDPGKGPWGCGNCFGISSTPATRCISRTAGGCCTAT
jgi:hypothetical protein